jgi:UDP-N-acetylglucosamine diphosphorylase / glucose-1-phosphate thymidylyltransferase / UDP-N-acetylgalactosamine diphosphorylase / glucosamine-1-phosphate N-acetyltransferase / galactosamine-1-phosphate N-acetyltransferase
MINIIDFNKTFSKLFPEQSDQEPWEVIGNLQAILRDKIKALSSDFVVKSDIAIHKTARIEEHCVIKGPAIIGDGVFIGAHAYLRGGVYLDMGTVIGPGCEIKTSIILSGTSLAHFNFAGDSIIGSNVNMEAGSVIANHFNERKDKTIFVLVNEKPQRINSSKFGALIGDGTRIGANAVLSPGTILEPNSIVKRLELVEQCPQ